MMSYCASIERSSSTDAAVPVIVPTFILPLVRQVFEDAYDKPFEEVMRTVDDYSQFDSTPSPDISALTDAVMRRLTRLLHPEMMRWIRASRPLGLS